MQWWDWVSVVGATLSFLGLTGTAIALVLAYKQIKRGVSVAEAIQVAIQGVTKHIASNQLLLLLPSLLQLQKDLDDAVTSNDSDASRKVLVQWHHQSNESRGLLAGMDWPDSDLLARLERSATMATKAKRGVMKGSKPLVEATEQARIAIEEVCAEVSVVAGRLRAEAGDRQ